MAVLLNVLALALVVGISWVGMMWLSGRVHKDAARADLDDIRINAVSNGDQCPECDGIGARPHFGGLEACELCEGRGIITTLT